MRKINELSKKEMTRTAGGKMREMNAGVQAGKYSGRTTGTGGGNDDIQAIPIWVPFLIMGAIGAISAAID